jgi:hypothetical protein
MLFSNMSKDTYHYRMRPCYVPCLKKCSESLELVAVLSILQHIRPMYYLNDVIFQKAATIKSLMSSFRNAAFYC